MVCLGGSMLSFMQLHYPVSSFNGRLQLGCKSKMSDGIHSVFSCDYNDIRERLKNFVFHNTSDYYITSNTFCGVNRVSNDLFSLHNIVIDIDCHDLDCYDLLHESLKSLIFRLNSALWSRFIPEPTSIVFTGRGLQLWWAIEGISSVFLTFYSEISDFYISLINNFLVNDDYFHFEDFSWASVDFVASRNILGYFRLPFTFNTKTATQILFTSSGTSYCLLDLIDRKHDFIGTMPQRPQPKINSSPLNKSNSIPTLYSLFDKRVKGLYLLRDLRDNDIGIEERNNFCFMMYNSLVPCCGHDLAFERMVQFNEGFKLPMSLPELNCVISSAKKKGGYQYSSSKFFEFLSISDEESIQIGLSSAADLGYVTMREKQSLRKKTEKENRDMEILKLYQNGLSQVAISSQMEVSLPTIRSVLKKSGIIPTVFNKTLALKLFLSGSSTSQISEECSCSIRTAQRFVSEQKNKKT